MANRKRLKKSIKLITGELFADCVALSLCTPDGTDKFKPLMTEVFQLHNDYVARLSHVEKGKEVEFFRKLRQEFTEKVNDLSDRIVNA
jgi:hypothetical protein